MTASTPYDVHALARLSGASTDRLRHWHRSGLLRGHAVDQAIRYGFPDLMAARAAMGLIGLGYSTRRVRQAVHRVQALYPNLDQPLSSVRISAEHGELVVQIDATTMETRTGQLLLKLDGPADPIAPAIGWPEPTPINADAWVARAEHLTGTSADADAIEDAFRAALMETPQHPAALMGLGNLLFAEARTEEARAAYHAATQAAPDCAAAWYNLGNTLDELNQSEASIRAFQAAILLEPEYSDAYFNLALAWEKLGRPPHALPHWRRFIELGGPAESTVIARAFVDAAEAQRADLPP